MAGPGRRWNQVVGPRIVSAVVARPWLWPTAAVQVFRLAPRRWWARQPRLPVPDPAYLRFRATTAYGDADRLPDPTDVLTWLEWCRAWVPATKVQSLKVTQG